jgi:hypothetical protein
MKVVIALSSLAVLVGFANTAEARGRHEAYDLTLVPPPPPTPVLNVAPPPVVLPYSFAYQNYQRDAAAHGKQERLTSLLIGANPASSASSAIPLLQHMPQALNSYEAKARGFGSARQKPPTRSWPGGASAAPSGVSPNGQPWHDSCTSWYLGHALSDPNRTAAAVIPSFQPVYPASLNGQAEPSAPPALPKPHVSGQSNIHISGFKNRRRIVATR